MIKGNKLSCEEEYFKSLVGVFANSFISTICKLNGRKVKMWIQ